MHKGRYGINADAVRNEKPAVVLTAGIQCALFGWHPLGESNPSFQDENLMS